MKSLDEECDDCKRGKPERERFWFVESLKVLIYQELLCLLHYKYQCIIIIRAEEKEHFLNVNVYGCILYEDCLGKEVSGSML